MTRSKAFPLAIGILWLYVEASINPNEPCSDGSCPTPGKYAASEESEGCGLWMGPSPIKDHEEHGFGLGMFTGKAIKAGETVDPAIFIPLFDWAGAAFHPPLLEYTWSGGGENYEKFNFMSHTGGFYFIPGIGSIVPCTDLNYNLKNIDEFEEIPDKHDKPNSGSYSTYTSLNFRAARDIAAGEELTVECTDDDFDGGSYNLNRYNPKEDGIMCLDDNLRIDKSTYLDAGKGVFSKRTLKMGQTILSTPMLPMHRQELQVPEKILVEYSTPEEQLLLNYCFGHPKSDLLWLPFGPIASYFNHHSTPNVKIQWHESKYVSLSKRQSYHHPELFDLLPSDVSKVHGMGLVLDFVALRDIDPSEEVFIDYGPEWNRAWEKHLYKWKPHHLEYMTAFEFQQAHDTTMLRTLREQYDHPYPTSIQFLCAFSSEWGDPEHNAGSVEFFYTQDTDHDCMTPCTIQDRYELDVVITNDTMVLLTDASENVQGKQKMTFYRVFLFHQDDNADVEYDCKIVPEVEYEYYHLPRTAITIADRPYSTTMSQTNAFRHPIGIGDLYPDTWLERQVRRKKPSLTSEDLSMESFKRKKPGEPVKKKASVTADL